MTKGNADHQTAGISGKRSPGANQRGRRPTLPTSMPAELLPVVIAECMAPYETLTIEETTDDQHAYTLFVPEAARERVAELIHRYQSQAEPVAPES